MRSPGPIARRVAVGCGVLALALGVAACGSGDSTPADAPADAGGAEPELLGQTEWDDLVEKAEEEGQLTVFSSAGSSDQYFKEFQEEYPEIAITIERQPTGDLISRLEQELSVDSPAADVAYHSQPTWFADKAEEEKLAPLQLSPDVAELYADEDELTRYYIPTLRNPWVFAYNTDTGAAPTTIEDALDLMEGAKVGVLDPGSSSANVYQWYMWAQQVDGFVEQMADLDHTDNVTTVPLLQSLAAGELSYVIPTVPGTLDPLIAEGAPVDQVVLEGEGGTGIQYGVGVTARAAHPHAAQLFVNWMTDKAGQQFMLEHFGPAAVVSGEGDSLVWDEVTPFESSDLTQDDLDTFVEEEWRPAMG